MSWRSVEGTKRYPLSYKALGKLLLLILLSFTKLYNFKKITTIDRDHYRMSIVLLCRGLFHDEYYFIIKLRHQLFIEVSKFNLSICLDPDEKPASTFGVSFFFLFFFSFFDAPGLHYSIDITHCSWDP